MAWYVSSTRLRCPWVEEVLCEWMTNVAITAMLQWSSMDLS